MQPIDRITKPFEIIECDSLVVGAGIAGLSAAIEAAKRRANVVLVNKGPLARSGLSVMAGVVKWRVDSRRWERAQG